MLHTGVVIDEMTANPLQIQGNAIVRSSSMYAQSTNSALRINGTVVRRDPPPGESEFRQRCVLTYTPTGVAADGWHPIEVKVKTRGAQVTARRGYPAAR
jgi:hypothetical protein